MDYDNKMKKYPRTVQFINDIQEFILYLPASIHLYQ